MGTPRREQPAIAHDRRSGHLESHPRQPIRAVGASRFSDDVALDGWCRCAILRLWWRRSGTRQRLRT
jgi:hypothetical protein